jgi:hypothetical protein
MAWQFIGERLDEIVTMVKVKSVEPRDYDGLDVGIDKFLDCHEFLPENVELSIAADETYEHDPAVRDRDERRDLGVGPQYQRSEVVLLDYPLGSPPLEATVAVMPVVKTLKVFRLLLQGCVAREPLSSEELPVVRVVEVFNRPVPPRLSYGNKDRGDAVVETEAHDNPQGTRIAIASPETQFIVNLQKFRDAHCLPALHEACRHLIVFFRPLGLDMHPVAEDIHNVEGVKSPIPFDIPGTDKIGLMNVIDARGLNEVGIFDSLGSI